MAKLIKSTPIMAHEPDCCGCWNIYTAEKDDIGPRFYAECNECDTVVDLGAVLGSPAKWPDILNQQPRPQMDEPEDDGTAERAAEIAVGWIATAWYRRTNYEGGSGGELMLALADAALANITPEQWRALAGTKS